MTSAPAKSESVGRAGALMASGSMVSRILGIVRNALLVFCVGAETASSTAFTTANTLPNQIFGLLQGGIITAILIPQITKAMRRGDEGKEAIDSLLTVAFLIVAIVTALAMVLTGPLIWVLGLRGDIAALGVMFAYICLPQILFYGAYAIWSQVLNANGRFGITMWTTVFANIVQIAGMVVFLSVYGKHTDATGWDSGMIWLLAGSFTLGIVIQAAALIPALIKSGHSWHLSLQLRGHGFRSAAKLAVWAITAVTIQQLGGFITTAAINTVTERATKLGEQVANITVYNQAFQTFMVPHGIVTVSILTAIFPRLARAYQSGDTAALRGDVTHALKSPILIVGPISVAALALAVPGMAVLNPGMSVHEINDTALVFAIMAVGLIPYAVSGLQQRYSMAREDGKTNMWFTLVVVGVQVITAALILLVPHKYGVIGVAIGQTLGNTIAAVVFLSMTQRQLGGLPLRSLAHLNGRVIAASLVPGALAWFASDRMLQRFALVSRTTASGIRTSYSFLPALAALAVGGVLFVVFFFVFARLLRLDDVTKTLRRLTHRLHRA